MKGPLNGQTGKVLVQTVLRISLILLLVAAAFIEGYYILVLRDKIDSQTEELRSLSAQLQSLKSERAGLSEELSSINKSSGEKKDGNTAEREH